MKRIVTFVVPVAPVDSPQGDEEGHAAGLVVEHVGNAIPEYASIVPGGMKVEVVVSDGQANRIISTLLEHGSASELPAGARRDEGREEDAIESLVQRELKTADPEAHDLLDRIVKRVERELISKVYSDCDYVKSRAAARLGINRNTLLKKLREFGEVADDAG
ncbi:DNA-binding protein Fis [Caulifigura coniformis]|uniref:DNA-binding protein Fis n=1 Tax=Caulifigura coniformis TaxID=2527983 RepID=A0A517S9X5_9PLAN|nr:helix-turn-helix domain-containing protein [Caulifigura coniformis]QDT52928.1 DNA-binding protein Fis [Caulifigura coniformis]